MLVPMYPLNITSSKTAIRYSIAVFKNVWDNEKHVQIRFCTVCMEGSTIRNHWHTDGQLQLLFSLAQILITTTNMITTIISPNTAKALQTLWIKSPVPFYKTKLNAAHSFFEKLRDTASQKTSCHLLNPKANYHFHTPHSLNLYAQSAVQ